MKRLLLYGLLLASNLSFVYAQRSLIPMPIHMEVENGQLSLAKGIVFSPSATDAAILKIEIADLKSILADWHIPVLASAKQGVPTVRLVLEDTKETKTQEAYSLKIDKEGILISASTSTGIFYALQTLRQLDHEGNQLTYLSISDAPAFSWRGFLLDVGRNYQPMDMLKEQIEVMARYKLNVLHFHFTEDLAWRLVSKKYPGLTDAAVMRRWKGQCYTEAEFRELIQYCKDRHIQFFPEIDMPGHSEAFERFFGVNMQSDSGMVYIKELLKEFRETYPEIENLHIGGDEVKIVNKNFMPEITGYVEGLGYKMTMGWDPGSNLSPQTSKQLWMGGPKVVEEKGNVVYIDSKHLYINHMDPLETVTTIFHRRLGEQDQEHKNFIGATLCAWPDRAVAAPVDMFYQNAIYPSLLAFAERSWHGGGRPLWLANILPREDKAYAAFKDFEGRLLTHKATNFKDKPFPYVKQTDLIWDLIGPFDNEGDLDKTFAIEANPFDKKIKVDKQVEGGTVVLRHWWSDVVQGAIDTPQNHTTWYARTKIYSAEAGVKDFWIGFDNLSRSYASDSPEIGTWDNRKSWVKVNGERIAPPLWKQAGMLGHLEKPYLDEGYSYREPTKIKLKKGWNDVLIKLPVKDFKGKNWQTPVKWMFTFVPMN